MTDSSPGPGWWLASDGNWYPPHLHPDARARAAAEAEAAAAATGTTRPGDEHLGRAVVADTVARAAAADAEIQQASRDTAAFAAGRADASTAGDADVWAGPTTDRPADRTAVLGAAAAGSIDDIVATSGGGIDWEAVARERAAQREARNQQSASTRRTVLIGAGVAVVALLGIFFVMRGGDDGPSRGVTVPGTTGTTAAPVTTAPATTAPATTKGPATTAASATTAPTTGATGSSTTRAPGTTTPGTTAAPGTTALAAGGTNVSVFSLAPGSCIDQENLTTGLVTTVRTVSCEQPHTHEVYLKTTVTPADATYDAAKVTTFANQACSDGFKTYVGIAYDQSKYYYLHLAPSAESWNKNKDRDVVCLLLLEGQRLTGSVKGKGE